MKRENYVDETDKMTTRNIMKIRLNMTEVRENFKGDRKMPPFCPLCNQERVVCLFLSTRPDVQYVIASFAILTAPDLVPAAVGK